jgi:uncharacterized membrane protein
MEQYFKWAVLAFEAISVAVLIFGFVLSMGHFVKRSCREKERHTAFRGFRHDFGQTLLLALDLLVAADIILTVTLDLNYRTLGMLGLLVVIRTFLHVVLHLDVHGRWPWQGSHGTPEAPLK